MLIWSDSRTRTCVLTLAIVWSNAAQAADTSAAYFCADADAQAAHLVMAFTRDDTVTIYPGGHLASGKIGALAWSDDVASYAFQGGRLVIVSPDSIMTKLCVEVSSQVRAVAERAIGDAPELLKSFHDEKMSRELSMAESINDALESQLQALQTLTNSDSQPVDTEPLCAAFLDRWENGGSAALMDLFGVDAGQYALACRP